MLGSIQTVIVCDDIRREDNGKVLIIGVYVGEIILHRMPSTLGLAFYCHAKSAKTGLLEFNFRVEHSRASEPLKGFATGKISIVSSRVGEDLWLMLPHAPFAFDQPSELVISAQEDGQWYEVARKKVVEREVPAPV